jgi:putative effector of murein hydrolase LrgA (UPF0299 family)
MFIEEYYVWNSLLCSFLHLPVTSSILGLYILLSSLYSNALDLPQSVFFP